MIDWQAAPQLREPSWLCWFRYDLSAKRVVLNTSSGNEGTPSPVARCDRVKSMHGHDTRLPFLHDLCYYNHCKRDRYVQK
jgi:hypothetical protein